MWVEGKYVKDELMITNGFKYDNLSYEPNYFFPSVHS